jgi:hypothetical protein
MPAVNRSRRRAASRCVLDSLTTTVDVVGCV